MARKRHTAYKMRGTKLWLKDDKLFEAEMRTKHFKESELLRHIVHQYFENERSKDFIDLNRSRFVQEAFNKTLKPLKVQLADITHKLESMEENSVLSTSSPTTENKQFSEYFEQLHKDITELKTTSHNTQIVSQRTLEQTMLIKWMLTIFEYGIHGKLIDPKQLTRESYIALINIMFKKLSDANNELSGMPVNDSLEFEKFTKNLSNSVFKLFKKHLGTSQTEQADYSFEFLKLLKKKKITIESLLSESRDKIHGVLKALSTEAMNTHQKQTVLTKPPETNK